MQNYLSEIQNRIIKFRNERDWAKFHNPKDVALSLSLEASELLELFQWKDEVEQKKLVINKKDEISDELADIFYWVMLMSHDLDIDILKAFDEKMIKNENKYPIEKFKGISLKYNEK